MLVNCVAYQDGQRIADLKFDEIAEYIKRPGYFIWVALLDAEPAELEALREPFGLHPLAIEDALRGHQRPKLEEYGPSLFAVMHLVEPTGNGLRIGELDIFAGLNYIVSARRGAEFGFQAVHARCDTEPHLLIRGAGYVLYALMDAVVDRYAPILHDLEVELDAIEDQVFSGSAPPRAVIASMYALKQKLNTLNHAVEPLLDVVEKLYGGRVPPICMGMDHYYRDIHDHLVRLDQTIDGTRDLVNTAMTVNLSLVAIRDNETTKQLAAYAALVAVPTLIAGIYGMNFEFMPELKWEVGYPLTLLVMVVLDVYLFLRFRRAGWL